MAGLGRSAGAGDGLLLGAVEVAGSGVDTLAAERAPSPSEGEGWGEGEGVGVLALVDATEPSGFSPSPRPSPAGRGGDAGSVCAGAAFTFSGGAQTTALAATVTSAAPLVLSASGESGNRLYVTAQAVSTTAAVNADFRGVSP